jgi:hypothetical protein
MKDSADELIAIARRYYARGTCGDDSYKETEENRRLVEARIRAGTGADRDRWRALLGRIREQFPGNSVVNGSIHLETGSVDACYSGTLWLTHPTDEHFHTVEFRVSFLVPYYIVYSERVVDDPDALKAHRASSSTVVGVLVGDTWEFIPAEVADPEFRAEEAKGFRRRMVSFDFSPEEAPFAAWIAGEIEATFDAERMPPEIGKVLVPEVSTHLQLPGEATLYDCLFVAQMLGPRR